MFIKCVLQQIIISKNTVYFALTYIECNENSQCGHQCGNNQRPHCSNDGHCHCVGKFTNKNRKLQQKHLVADNKFRVRYENLTVIFHFIYKTPTTVKCLTN